MTASPHVVIIGAGSLGMCTAPARRRWLPLRKGAVPSSAPAGVSTSRAEVRLWHDAEERTYSIHFRFSAKAAMVKLLWQFRDVHRLLTDG
jgi:hypothetical protein